MKRLIHTIIITLFAVLSAHSQNVDSLLEVLDDCIIHKDEFRALRQQRIDSLKNDSGGKAFDKYFNLYQNYSHLQTDSALHYLELMSNLPEVKNDPKQSTITRLDEAEQLAIMGAYYKAKDTVEKMTTEGMDQQTRIRYYHVCRTIYGWIAAYFSKTSTINKEMLEKTNQYRDSIIATETDDVVREVVQADYLITEGQAEKGIEILLRCLGKAQNEYKTYCYYNLSEAYRQLHDTDNQTVYLVKAAIEDISRGVAEYAALPALVKVLTDKGDVKRAYEYMICSMEDANNCNALLRSLEISEIYPILEKEHNQREAEEKKAYIAFACGLALLTILLAIASLYLRKEAKALSRTKAQLADANKQLEEANEQLEEANSNLEEANNQLEEANNNLEEANNQLKNTNQGLESRNVQLHEKNIDLNLRSQLKEDYIALFISRCRKYITSLEKYRKSLLKLAKNNKAEELLKTLKDDSLVEAEEEKFYKDFDEAFLDIHPQFVQNFNELLNEDSQITLKKGELLNVELRIYALIRLGITDINQIAEFLNYSIPTIYNYRSRIRTKSKFSKEEFDRKVMEL